jgi:hypothetical protein
MGGFSKSRSATLGWPSGDVVSTSAPLLRGSESGRSELIHQRGTHEQTTRLVKRLRGTGIATRRTKAALTSRQFKE